MQRGEAIDSVGWDVGGPELAPGGVRTEPTQGRWQLGRADGRDPHKIIATSEDGDEVVICRVSGFFVNRTHADVYDDPRCAEGLANGYLMAASKEMRAALAQMVTLCGALLGDSAAESPAVLFARGVLAKAGGDAYRFVTSEGSPPSAAS